MKTIKSTFHVHNKFFMKPIRIIYGLPPCTYPDWDGTVTEQKNIHPVVYFDFKRCKVSVKFYLFNVNPPFQKS